MENEEDTRPKQSEVTENLVNSQVKYQINSQLGLRTNVYHQYCHQIVELKRINRKT